jgi:hypothetical protein
MRRLLVAVALLPLAVMPFYYRWTYMSWDSCRWLLTEATVITREQAGLPIDLLPSEDPLFDWSFARILQLVEPYHSEGRCLPRWARLRFLSPPPVVALLPPPSS